ncbi:MAG: hypothetical protein QME81_20550, partial [bacterium]|nr:hypothetical protein [bacterium]
WTLDGSPERHNLKRINMLAFRGRCFSIENVQENTRKSTRSEYTVLRSLLYFMIFNKIKPVTFTNVLL